MDQLGGPGELVGGYYRPSASIRRPFGPTLLQTRPPWSNAFSCIVDGHTVVDTVCAGADGVT